MTTTPARTQPGLAHRILGSPPERVLLLVDTDDTLSRLAERLGFDEARSVNPTLDRFIPPGRAHVKTSGITLLSCLSATVLAASAVHPQQAPRRIAAGEAYSNSRGTVYGFRTVGAMPARLLNHLVVDKGAPRVRLVAPTAKSWRPGRGERACPGVICVRCA